MIRIAFMAIFCLSSVWTYTQNNSKLGSRLGYEMDNGHQTKFKVAIEFHENTDLDALKVFFEQNNIKAGERPSYVIKALQETASKSQERVLHFLGTKYPQDQIHAFWIVNRIIIKLDRTTIPDLLNFDEIAQIELETAKFLPLDPIEITPQAGNRFQGGVEPGLIAINAPAMWKLGYTGRGTLVYNFDTGVWKDHPAFEDRYLGKRFPQSQSWLGIFRDYPNGITSSHGTHTLGSMAGLDEENKDTIGIAFKAYWIANDYVVSSVETLPPLEELAYGFEWALNPDGNINTNDDVPDVINNSWRFSDEPTTEYCDSWVVDLMNAIETAGIANVFSGGNAGPSNTTVSAPQRINTSVVNTFSVGSVDANQLAPYPISDFSTRGPTQCDGSGSLKIHPQVVAPGQNVRSAWGNGEYNSISGTSMAAPHVSGAVLLLKEAFPDLSGEDLLWALYHTAIDYGPPGEDNTFGNGLIDVKAAFDLLSQNNVPVDPRAVQSDLAAEIDAVSAVETIICNGVIQPKLLLKNLGQNDVTTLNLFYWFSGSDDTVHIELTQLIPPHESVAYQMQEIHLDAFGKHELNIEIQNADNTFSEYDVYNNRCKLAFNRVSEKTVPVFEDFELGINEDYWIIENPDLDIGWDTFPVNGLGNSAYAACLQFYKYTPRNGQKDILRLSNIHLPETEELFLDFDYAYQPFFGSTTIRDTFRVFISEDCSDSTKNLLFEGAGQSLYVSDSVFINFKPQYAGHWKNLKFSLKDYEGKNISVLFEGTNMKWNNLYLDNVRIDGLSKIKDKGTKGDKSMYTIYPNPVSESLNIYFIEDQKKVNVEILDITGTTRLKARGNKIDELSIDISSLPNGIYFVRIDLGARGYIEKIIKNVH